MDTHKPVGSKLESLKTQRTKLNRRIQKMEAREKVQNRKQDTRRKILVGAYYLSQATKDNTLPELKKSMLSFLTRENDKTLFEE